MVSNQMIIKDAIKEIINAQTPEIVQNSVRQIIQELTLYLNKLDNLYDRMGESAQQKLNIYSGINTNETTTTYALYKELKNYDIEATSILQEGYVLIDELRSFFTNETITYDIGFTYRGTLYEMTMTLEELLANTRATYNTRSKFNDLYKLRMSVRKGDLVKAYNEASQQVEKLDDGSSTIYSSIWRYLNDNPSGKAINKGNVYEAYKVYKAEVGANPIPPAEFKASRFDEILTEVRQNTASSIKGGDYLNSQIKFLSAAPSLVTTNTIRITLNEVLNIFSQIAAGGNRQDIINQIDKLFVKSLDQISYKGEIEARDQAEEYIVNLVKKLTN